MITLCKRGDEVQGFCSNKTGIIKPAAWVVANAVELARPHFIGPLNELMNRVNGREVVTAFRIRADPVRALNLPLNVPEKTMVLNSTVFFTQSFEALVNTMHGRTELAKDVVIPLVLDLLVNYSEFITAFKAWRMYEIPIAYARMGHAVDLMRAQYLEIQAGAPAEMNLLNNMMDIMNHMEILEREYPELLNQNVIPY